jgi:hypothetical protein
MWIQDGKGVHTEPPKWIDTMVLGIEGVMTISLIGINVSWLGMWPERMVLRDFRDNIYRNTSTPE